MFYDKKDPTPLDDMPIVGLTSVIIGAYKQPMILYKGSLLSVWLDRDNKPRVHIFGEMDLPIFATIEEAWKKADYIASECGYIANKRASSLWLRGEGKEAIIFYQDDVIHNIEVFS